MNKALLTFLVVFLCQISVAFSGTIVIEGKYQNKNLYIQNSYGDDGVGFCAYEVLINGQITTDEVASRTFEIDFSSMPIKAGSHVIVEIRHKDNCAPKVLNPEVLKSQPTFEVVDMKIEKNGILTWNTVNENEPIPYIIEQFRWNKWIKVGEVKGKGLNKGNSYSFKPVLNSGENKFRVKQVGFQGVERRSDVVTITSSLSPFGYKVNNDKSVVQFSGETLFEVYDVYGEIVEYGYGDSLNISNLSKGFYFLCFDNTVVDFTK